MPGKQSPTLIEECPGAADIKTPKPTYQACPACGEEVEIWSDEVEVICGNCGETVFGESMPSCIEWCEHAEKCVGVEKYKRIKGRAKTDEQME